MKKYFSWLIPVLGLAALILIVYYPVGGFEFLQWDDDYQIYQNPHFQNSQWIPFWKEPYMGLYIPVVYTVWSVLYHVTSTPDATVFHIFNVCFHFLNAFLVFWLIRKILNRNSAEKNQSHWIPALAGAILFAIHPLQVAAVAWVSGGRDLMSSFLALLALIFYFDRKKRADYIFSFIFFSISLLCKPGVVSLPLVFFLMDWCLRKKLFSSAPFFLAGIVLIPLTRYSQEFYMQGMSHQEWYYRPLIALDAIGFYISKFFVPVPLAVDYGRIPEKIIMEQQFWPFLILALMGLAVAVWSLRFGKTIWIGLMIFASGLLPVLGLIPFNFQRMSTVTDHYMYFPIIGLALILSALLDGKIHRAFVGIYSGVIVILIVISSQRLPIWQSFFPFFEDMLAKNPKSHSAYVNMGDRYFKLGNVKMAEELFRGGLREHPMSGIAAEDLGYVLLFQGRYEEVIQTLKPFIDNKEYDYINAVHSHTIALTYSSYAGALWQVGQLEESFRRYCQALAYKPRGIDEAKIRELMASVQAKLKISNPQFEAKCER